jgi:hypothetical protein
VEQRAGDAGSDGNQIALASKYFDLAGTGKFGKIDSSSGADASGSQFVRRDARHETKQFAGVNEEFM